MRTRLVKSCSSFNFLRPDSLVGLCSLTLLIKYVIRPGCWAGYKTPIWPPINLQSAKLVSFPEFRVYSACCSQPAVHCFVYVIMGLCQSWSEVLEGVVSWCVFKTSVFTCSSY